MATNTSERGLEEMIESRLLGGDFISRTSAHFSREYCLDEGMLREFLLATQSERVSRARIYESASNERKFLERVRSSVTQRGVVDVLRHGVSHNSYDFDLYYPAPSAGNQQAIAQNLANRWAVVRQLHYSETKPLDSIDMVLTLNGLPIVTMELKNELSCQDCERAVKQYKRDRPPKELLFMPKRCAVHFAVDDSEVRMCTWLSGEKSWFLPFNKGVDEGAGNPVNPNGVKTAYLWEEILQKPTLSLILESYAQVVKERDEDTGVWKERNIWPRYHQLESVRLLLSDTQSKTVGQRYLIQHSAGSGKSNSITWLAYQLVGLREADEVTPRFKSVIVVTDRVNLDRQIRDNIKSFCNNRSIVAWADDSAALKSALQGGKKIIVSTVCKFPFILESIGGELRESNFAVIIDEAHSSQSGSMSSALNRVLAGYGLQGVEIEDDEDGLAKLMEHIVDGRRLARNVNFYAFTATPKGKTLEMFGTPRPQSDGETKYAPFHLYSMRQAIEEGFIMDVLEHYTTYDSYYKILKATEANPEFDRDQARKKLRLWVESRPETVEKKARIMVEYFHENVAHKMDGEARCMIVCNGIERAIAYYHKVKELLAARKSPYGAIVAFSGTKEYHGKQLDETLLNGFASSRIEKEFGRGKYRFLIVADKFQTGYDQPLLHTMYVDKPLKDIKTVQTLSRLNRCHPLKRETYVLDFVNKAQDVEADFQRYYRKTILSRETDVNKVADKLSLCDRSLVYDDEAVEDFNRRYWGGAERSELDPILDTCVANFKTLPLGVGESVEETSQIAVKSAMKQFVRLYEFLSGIRDIRRPDWEMKSTFIHFLLRKLPRLPREDWAAGLLELVDFDSYRVAKQCEAEIRLKNEDAEVEPIPVGTSVPPGSGPDLETLERIIDDFNQVFGDIEWGDADVVRTQVRQVVDKLQKSDDVRDSILNNDEELQLQVVHESISRELGVITANSSEMQRRYLSQPSLQERLDTLVLMRLQQCINPDFNEQALSAILLDEFTPDFRELRGARPLVEAIEWLFKVLDARTIPSPDGITKVKRTINLIYRTSGRSEDRYDWLTLLTDNFEAYLKKMYHMERHTELRREDGGDAQFLDAEKALHINHLHFTDDAELQELRKCYEFLRRNAESHDAPEMEEEEVTAGIHRTLAMYLYATLVNIAWLERGEVFAMEAAPRSGYGMAAEGGGEGGWHL